MVICETCNSRQAEKGRAECRECREMMVNRLMRETLPVLGGRALPQGYLTPSHYAARDVSSTRDLV